MIAVNCGALPGNADRERAVRAREGRLHGRAARQAGRFELAHGSTLFLDEIGDLPLGLQAKLLRVLQERRFERLGSTRRSTVDVRIIAATNRDLSSGGGAGSFREDLYYRLNVFPIRCRRCGSGGEDIPLLVWRFVAEFGTAVGKHDRDDAQRLDALGATRGRATSASCATSSSTR